MARSQHTFAKRQREMEKKRKADEKREKRRNKGRSDAEGGRGPDQERTDYSSTVTQSGSNHGTGSDRTE
jgi:hypothetical protein